MRAWVLAVMLATGCGDNLNGHWTGECVPGDTLPTVSIVVDLTEGSQNLVGGPATVTWDSTDHDVTVDGTTDLNLVTLQFDAEDYQFELDGSWDGDRIDGTCTEMQGAFADGTFSLTR